MKGVTPPCNRRIASVEYYYEKTPRFLVLSRHCTYLPDNVTWDGR